MGTLKVQNSKVGKHKFQGAIRQESRWTVFIGRKIQGRGIFLIKTKIPEGDAFHLKSETFLSSNGQLQKKSAPPC